MFAVSWGYLLGDLRDIGFRCSPNSSDLILNGYGSGEVYFADNRLNLSSLDRNNKIAYYEHSFRLWAQHKWMDDCFT